jgi:hypothetical protein
MEMVKQFIINIDTYDRMNSMEDGDTPLTYQEFYDWNIKCLNESPDDLAWLSELCKRMANYKIQLMDEESCARMTAYAFYFDNDKNIVIVNPR